MDTLSLRLADRQQASREAPWLDHPARGAEPRRPTPPTDPPCRGDRPARLGEVSSSVPAQPAAHDRRTVGSSRVVPRTAVSPPTPPPGHLSGADDRRGAT